MGGWSDKTKVILNSTQFKFKLVEVGVKLGNMDGGQHAGDCLLPTCPPNEVSEDTIVVATNYSAGKETQPENNLLGKPATKTILQILRKSPYFS